MNGLYFNTLYMNQGGVEIKYNCHQVVPHGGKPLYTKNYENRRYSILSINL